MSKPTKLEDMTFQELVDEATQEIHLGLLEAGGKGLRNAVFLWLSTTAQWRDLRNHKEGKS